MRRGINQASDYKEFVSYPSTLSTKINRISNYRQNVVKILPTNSLTNIRNTNGSYITFVLPPNSLVDMYSLAINANFSTEPCKVSAAGGGGEICTVPYYLCKDANNLVERITVQIGGISLPDLTYHNRINNIYDDLQYSYEGKSKRLFQNMDAMTKYSEVDGDKLGLGCVETTNAAGALTNQNVALDKRPITLSNFIGFLGGSPQYIHTQIFGEIRITFYLAPAANVLFKANQALDNTGGAMPAGDNIPAYHLDDIYATITKCTINDDIYYKAIKTALEGDIPFSFKYKHYESILGNSTTTQDTNLRFEVSGGSIDLILFTFYDNAYLNNVGLLGGMTNAQQAAQFLSLDQATPQKVGSDGTDSYWALRGAKSSYTSQFFNRVGTYVNNIQFTINGENVPSDAQSQQDIYKQLLVDFGHNVSIDNGINPAINSTDSFRDNFWLASCRLDHLCTENYISGFDTAGVPLNIQVKTVSTGGAPVGGNVRTFTPHLIVEMTKTLEIYSGRNVIKRD
jgi:hypothetical protein